MLSDGTSFNFTAIGYVQSPFKDRFAVPRQHGFAAGVKGVVKLENTPDIKTALRDLHEFTHIWVLFVFHAHGSRGWKASIRPPRFGGTRKVGVLASRSPHRPNPIGMSAVKLERIDIEASGGPELHIAGHDLVDGTPVLDIKPYIAAVDIVSEANSGWAAEPIKRWPVQFSQEAEAQILQAEADGEDDLRELVVGILEIDPRLPARQLKSPVDATDSWGSRYGLEVSGFEVKYEIRDGLFLVLSLNKL